jgi:outer membrane lipoprotein-sorting protein
MSRPRSTIALLALVAALALAGCMGGGGTPTPEPMSDEAQALQERSIDAMQDVDTYAFDMTMDMDADQGSVSMDAGGVVNRAEKRLRMALEMDLPGQSTDTEMYIDGDTAYVKVRSFWQTQDVTDRNLWDQNSQLQRQRELMEVAHLEIVGNDTVDGVPVRVVEFTIPDDKLDELTAMAQQQSNTDEGTITDASYTAYVGTEDDLMRRMEADFTIEIEDMTADASITMQFRDFGMDTNITVPEEATGTGDRSAVAGADA